MRSALQISKVEIVVLLFLRPRQPAQALIGLRLGLEQALHSLVQLPGVMRRPARPLDEMRKASTSRPERPTEAPLAKATPSESLE